MQPCLGPVLGVGKNKEREKEPTTPFCPSISIICTPVLHPDPTHSPYPMLLQQNLKRKSPNAYPGLIHPIVRL